MRKIASVTALASPSLARRAGGPRAVDVCLWVSGCLLAAPILIFRYPPMGDLPFHESIIAVLLHFGDAGFVAPGLYERSFGTPNQLFPLAAWGLSLLLPTDAACKILLAASVASTPTCAARLARHFARSEWAGLLAAPMTLGFAFRWGLLGNVISLPLLLLGLPVLDRFAARPTRGLAAAAAGVMAGLYLAHESALVVGVTACAIFAVRAEGGLAAAAARLSPAGVGVVLAAGYALRSHALKAPSILAVHDAFGANPLERLIGIPRTLFGLSEAPVLYGTFALYSIALALFVLSARGPAAKPPLAGPLRRRFEAHRLLLLAAACAIEFLVAPLSYGGSTLLYQRFLPVASIFFVVALGPAGGAHVRALPVLSAFASTLALLAVELPAFGEADARFRDLDRLMPLIAMDSAVAQLDVTPRSPSLVAPIPGAAARVLAERGGRLLFSFADAPTSPVHMPAEHQWNEPVLRLAYDPLAFCPGHDLRRFRYALVRLAPTWASRMTRAIVAAMAPEGLLIAQEGEWLLFESTLEVAPITAAADPRPPAQASLRARLAQMRPGASDPGSPRDDGQP